LLKGKPVFTYNLLAVEKFRWEGQEPLTPGKHTLEFDFKYNGPGMAKGGTGVLRADGKDVANHTIAHTIPVLLTFDETFDIGSDTRTPVDDADYQVPFHLISQGWLSPPEQPVPASAHSDAAITGGIRLRAACADHPLHSYVDGWGWQALIRALPGFVS
jgi:hypothetical protein